MDAKSVQFFARSSEAADEPMFSIFELKRAELKNEVILPEEFKFYSRAYCSPTPKYSFDRVVRAMMDKMRADAEHVVVVYCHSDETGRAAGTLYEIARGFELRKITAKNKKPYSHILGLATKKK